MLKPRNTYSSIETYNYALWNELATAETYALDPVTGTYVTFLYNNEETKDLGKPDTFFFMTPKGKSRNYNVQDAQELHTEACYLIKDEPTRAVKLKMTNDIPVHEYGLDGVVKYFNVKVKGEDVPLFSNSTLRVGKGTWENVSQERWVAYLERLKDIMLVIMFRGYNNETHSITSEFSIGEECMWPLINKHVGPNRYACVKVRRFASNLTNHGHVVLYYGQTSVNFATTFGCKFPIVGVVNAFIKAIDDVYNEWVEVGENPDAPMYAGIKYVETSPERIAFGEYVGGRETRFENSKGVGRGLIMTINSDVTIGASKAWLNVEADFLKNMKEAMVKAANSIVENPKCTEIGVAISIQEANRRYRYRTNQTDKVFTK